MPGKRVGLVLCVTGSLGLIGADPAAGQESIEATIVYQRETFQYPQSGRPDPFRSLLLDGDLGIRIEDLTLRGVVHHTDPSLSVAFLTLRGSDRRIQARAGERVGPLRVLAIYPDQVEVVVEELGVARRETLQIEGSQSEGNPSPTNPSQGGDR